MVGTPDAAVVAGSAISIYKFILFPIQFDFDYLLILLYLHSLVKDKSCWWW